MLKSKRIWCRLAEIAAVLTSGVALGGVPAAAQDPAQFYGGRSISIVMGTSPGGSYDLYGRVIAQHLSKQIPGRPNIIVEHMPGAGGMAAGNYIYGPGPQDGSKILLSHALPLMEKLEDPKVIRYESRKLQWIGAYDQIEQIMALWHTNGVSTIEDLKSKDMVVGSMGTNHPVSPWTTTSGIPPVAVATTASSHAMASRLTMPSGS